MLDDRCAHQAGVSILIVFCILLGVVGEVRGGQKGAFRGIGSLSALLRLGPRLCRCGVRVRWPMSSRQPSCLLLLLLLGEAGVAAGTTVSIFHGLQGLNPAVSSHLYPLSRLASPASPSFKGFSVCVYIGFSRHSFSV